VQHVILSLEDVNSPLVILSQFYMLSAVKLKKIKEDGSKK